MASSARRRALRHHPNFARRGRPEAQRRCRMFRATRAPARGCSLSKAPVAATWPPVATSPGSRSCVRTASDPSDRHDWRERPSARAAGLVHLLPSRRVQPDLQIHRTLRLLAGRGLAPYASPRAEHAHPGPPLPPRLGDQRRRQRDVPAQPACHRALQLPAHQHPDPHGRANSRQHHLRQRHEHVESRLQWNLHTPVRRAGRRTHRSKDGKGAPVRPLHRAPDRRGQGRRARRVLPASGRLVG